MHFFQKLKFLLSVHIVICARIFETLQSDEEYFLIKNLQSGMVLDAREKFVTLQPVTGNSTQHWKLEVARGGTYYIVNKANDKVLDLDYNYSPANTWVVVSERLGPYHINCKINNGIPTTTMNMDACQKWHIHYNGVFVNVCSYIAITIKNSNYKPGVYLETWGVSGNGDQKFKLDYV